MSTKTEHSQPEWHLLEFYRDKSDSCALTVSVNNDRLHVIADSANFKADTDVARVYKDKLQKLTQDEAASNKKSNDSNGSRADSGVSLKELDAKEEQREKAEEAMQSWMLDAVFRLSRFDASSDSSSHKVSVQDWYHCKSHFYELRPSRNGDKVEAKQLQNTTELEKRMHDLIPSMALPKYITEGTTKSFYNAKDLVVVTSSDQPPGTPYHPCRVQVKGGDSGSARTLFLKIVDKNQLAPLKRELDVLFRIESRELHKQMRVPVVEGLVYFDGEEQTAGGKKRIMGFLQTDIPSATPLTESLDPSIPQTQREKWAREAERMKNLLHKNDIIWGDAKADNFMVDADENLWIIDFGGSYTEGWVDPAKAETIEGDDEGVARVVNALIDPINNMEHSEDEEGNDDDDDDNDSDEKDQESEKGKDRISAEASRSPKRKRSSENESEDRQSSPSREKKRRQSSTSPVLDEGAEEKQASAADEDGDDTYCVCQGTGDGDMVACDGEECAKEWFHFSCVGLDRAPPEDQEWFCSDCRE